MKSIIKEYRKLILLTAIPVVLCLILSLQYDSKNMEYTTMNLFFVGLFITCIAFPIYSAALCWRNVIHKYLQFKICAAVCLIMNVLANSVLTITFGVISEWLSVVVLTHMAFSLASLSLMMIWLLGVNFLIKRRLRKENNE